MQCSILVCKHQLVFITWPSVSFITSFAFLLFLWIKKKNSFIRIFKYQWVGPGSESFYETGHGFSMMNLQWCIYYGTLLLLLICIYTNSAAHFEYKAERYMEAIIILSATTALPFKMTKRLTALHCDLFGKCLSQLVCQLCLSFKHTIIAKSILKG